MEAEQTKIMAETWKTIHWIYPISFIIGGFLMGILVGKILLVWLKRLANRARWEGQEILMAPLHRWTTFWFTLSGIYGASLTLPLTPPQFLLIQKTLIVVAIFTVTLVTTGIAVGFIRLYSQRAEGVLPSTSIFINLTKVLLSLIGVLTILQALGISITPILTALGVGGLAVALALQETLSNLFAGLHILLSRQVKPGDYVRLDSGDEGVVTDITWRNTFIRAPSDNVIIIPNVRVSSSIVTNYSLPQKETGIVISLGVNYGSDLEKVERVTTEVAKEVMKEVPGGIPDFAPFIRYHTIGESGVSFSIILRVREFASQYLIRHELIKRLLRRYTEEGIEISIPARTLYVREKPPGS